MRIMTVSMALTALLLLACARVNSNPSPSDSVAVGAAGVAATADPADVSAMTTNTNSLATAAALTKAPTEEPTEAPTELIDILSKSGSEGCLSSNGDAPIDGIVKKREYLDDEITLSAVVIEEIDGQRYSVNIDHEHVGLSRWGATEVSQALTLNRKVKIKVVGCGAAGLWFIAKEIRAYSAALTNAPTDEPTEAPTELINILSKSESEGCLSSNGDAPIDGIVKKREYLDDEITLSAVVIEEIDGQRYSVNIDHKHVGLRRWGATEVSQVLTLNRKVKIKVVGCGAAGLWFKAREIRAY